MTTKYCTVCNQHRSIDDFHTHMRKNGHTWRRNVCRECHNEHQRIRRREKYEKNEKANFETRFYQVLENGGCFRGKLPITGFRETVKAGYFPDGMKVRRLDTKKEYIVKGDRMVKC